MEASPPSAIDLSRHLYHQIVYTLTDLLPQPLDGSPEALRARNHAAIAKVAALLPIGASEIDLAAQWNRGPARWGRLGPEWLRVWRRGLA